MSTFIESRLNLHEHTRGPLEGMSVDGKIRYYGGSFPRTIIDLPRQNRYVQDHLTLTRFSNFEFGKEGDPDTVKLHRGHHEGEVLFALQDALGNGNYRYDLISPTGFIGSLETEDKDSLAPFLASLFHSHQQHLDLSAGTRVDSSVLDYISQRTGLVINIGAGLPQESSQIA